ncbi:TPA: hypothetical protein DCW56_01220 [Candidatus Peregrinibacteria bacterium]|nr:MAG: hypothetical protein UW03_C0026G0007 [Candidatus Peregrinibacteria bacterium GW2011_GWA2_43_8]HAU39538.1 hypothetical protein [Candidatus Peregrinibacteria bacterium]
MWYNSSVNIFEKVFKSLNKARIQYVVVGGVAVNLHGYVRFTGDLDLLVLMEEENLKKMDKVMKSLGYSERLPVSLLALKDRRQVQKWLKEKNMRAYSFVPLKDNPLQIDIIVDESLRFPEFEKNKIVKRISDTPIPVVSIQDLIKMKKKAGREQDFIDLEALINLKSL